MMELGVYPAMFYLWWVFINGFLCFFEILFLQNLTGVKEKWHASVCLLASCVLAFLMMRFHGPKMCGLILHTIVIFGFFVLSVKLKVLEAIVPVAVILMLYTFMEGFQFVFMDRLVEKNMSVWMGALLQISVSGLTAVLTATGLFIISKGLSDMMKAKESSYLCTLQYLDEARRRNERYAAFQHDIDNHLLVLSGLVQERRYAEAEKYSENLSRLSDSLTGGIDTGNLAADILLREKINFAEANGIQVRLDVHFSKKYSIDDADLCTLLANAMDNAIKACMQAGKGKPRISAAAGMKRHFLIISVTNTTKPSGYATAHGQRTGGCCVMRGKDYGTGLKNIRRTVRKYGGTMETVRGEEEFAIRMLLCLGPAGKAK